MQPKPVQSPHPPIWLGATRGAATAALDVARQERYKAYQDYRTVLMETITEAELAYWRGQLAGIEALELPADRPRPAVQSTRGARWPWSLHCSPCWSAVSPQASRNRNLYDGALL